MLSVEKRTRGRETMGTALKDERLKAGFTQKALADMLGLEYYTMISQIELGYMALPVNLWAPIAHALGINRAQWVARCAKSISPDHYKALFGNQPVFVVVQMLDLLDKGVIELLIDEMNKSSDP